MSKNPGTTWQQLPQQLPQQLFRRSMKSSMHDTFDLVSSIEMGCIDFLRLKMVDGVDISLFWLKVVDSACNSTMYQLVQITPTWAPNFFGWASLQSVITFSFNHCNPLHSWGKASQRGNVKGGWGLMPILPRTTVCRWHVTSLGLRHNNSLFWCIMLHLVWSDWSLSPSHLVQC